jgi:hypothetical protein
MEWSRFRVLIRCVFIDVAHNWILIASPKQRADVDFLLLIRSSVRTGKTVLGDPERLRVSNGGPQSTKAAIKN